MTREEAIQVLANFYVSTKNQKANHLCEAVYIAMQALKSEPKHGRWEQVEVVHDRKDAKIQDWQQAKCSVCGKWHTTPFMYYLKLDNYCPNCGSRMDEVCDECI